MRTNSKLQPLFHLLKLSLLLGISCNCLHAAELNVLIVGTTKDKGEANGWADSKPFDITKVKTELENILSGGNHGTVNVGLHDFSLNGDYTYRNPYDHRETLTIYSSGNSLIQEFYNTGYLSTYGFPPTADQFWANLRGDNGTDWHYVILMGEPYNIEQFPGIYTHGVAEVGKEVIAGGAEPVLLMGWPGSGSSSTVDHYKEVVYRTGRTLGYKVAPAGLAWEAQGSNHGGGHPSNDNAYLAAASIYSRIMGQSASVSTYADNKDTLADAIHQTVTTAMATPQYTGLYQQPSRIFDIMHHQDRAYGYNGPSSSTENGVRAMCRAIMEENGLDATAGDGALPRPAKGVYLNRSLLTDEEQMICMWFHHPGNSSRSNESYYDVLFSTLARTLRSMDRTLEAGDTNVRYLPNRLLWAQFCKEYPDENLIESSHGSRHWKRVVAAYTHTITTGRCAIGPKPPEGTNAYKDWVSARIGYETAWRLGRLQGRAPGFRVMPSGNQRHFVDPDSPETMTVQFVLPPKQNVTVNIATDQPWATVTPSVLNFTAGDTTTVQEVTVQVNTAAGATPGAAFNVTYTTSSSDDVCHGLTESWAYGVNTLPVPQDQTLEVVSGGFVQVAPNATDVNIKQKFSHEIVTQPSYGTVEVIRVNATDYEFRYTPDPGFVGVDRLEFVSRDGLTTSAEVGTMTFLVYPTRTYNANLLFNPSAELTPLPENGWTGSLVSAAGASAAPARTGNRVFEIPADLANAQSHQDVRLYSYANHINDNLQYFQLQGYVDDAATDDVRIRLEFRDSNGQVLGTPYESTRANSTDWTFINETLLAPAGSVTARVILKGSRLGGAETMGWLEDLSLTAVAPDNSAPVATDTPVRTIPVDTPIPIELTATDIDDDILTYRVIDGPQFGTITGFDADGMPLYLSNAGYLGNDSFTYVANDGEFDSNVAMASITVQTNQRPVVEIGLPTSNVIYMTQTNGIIVEATVTDDGAPANGELALSWNANKPPYPVAFSNPNSTHTTVNWGDFNTGKYSLVLNAHDGQMLGKKGLTIFVIDPPYEHPDGGNIAPQVDVGGPYTDAVAGQPLQLEGVEFFNDDKNPGLGYTAVEWLMISGPGNAEFSDASDYRSQVSFDAPGDYVLRLTAFDGQVKVYEDVAISVSGDIVLPASYAAWANSSFVHEFSNPDPSANDDGDQNSSMMEFAFGTDPTIADGGSLAMDGSANGNPITVDENGDIYIYFVRRKDFGSVGSVDYIVQFSSNLADFTPHAATPQLAPFASPHPDYEVVRVAYPPEAQFGRIEVNFHDN